MVWIPSGLHVAAVKARARLDGSKAPVRVERVAVAPAPSHVYALRELIIISWRWQWRWWLVEAGAWYPQALLTSMQVLL